MGKYSGYIYAGIILMVGGGLFAINGYTMVQNVEEYNVGGIPVSDFFRILSSDINNYYIYGLLFWIGGMISCGIGCVLLFVFAFIQNKESIAKNKVKNVPSQNNMKSAPYER